MLVHFSMLYLLSIHWQTKLLVDDRRNQFKPTKQTKILTPIVKLKKWKWGKKNPTQSFQFRYDLQNKLRLNWNSSISRGANISAKSIQFTERFIQVEKIWIWWNAIRRIKNQFVLICNKSWEIKERSVDKFLILSIFTERLKRNDYIFTHISISSLIGIPFLR